MRLSSCPGSKRTSCEARSKYLYNMVSALHHSTPHMSIRWLRHAKYLVGHVIYDVTEKVYTKRDFEWMKSEMKKIR